MGCGGRPEGPRPSSGRIDTKAFEESPKLKSKSLLSILAVVAAALMPLAAISQIAPERQKRARDDRAHL